MSSQEPIVDVTWLMEHLADPGVVVVDARPAGDYRAAHIPGARQSDMNALRMPVSTPEAVERFQRSATAEVRRLGIRPGDRVVFYEGISGALAPRGVWLLDYLGIPGSAMLDGGLAAWVEAGGAVEQRAQAVEPSTIESAPVSAVLATADEIARGLESDAARNRVLDTRSDLEYRAGTIPGSIHLEWTRALDETGRFRPLEEIEALFARHGLTADAGETVVTFCGSGYRAAHSYVLLKTLGFASVKNYAPSWGEWGNRGDLPVEHPGR
jgi:thiosulfate/3-mercaptopyruvate sulfurtransferase